MNGRRGLRSVNWRSLLAATALSALAVPAAAVGSAHAQVVHAPASLVQQADSAPNRMINVIVEKHGATTAPEALVRRLGGKVTKNLSIINAVAATIPGRAVRRLATNSSVNWLSPDGVVHQEGRSAVNTANLVNYYDSAIGADRIWGRGYDGSGVNVAVVDSGITPDSDLSSGRIVASTSVVPGDPTTTDGYGHGSHVSGIIAGNGSYTNGQYIGIAPRTGIVNVKVFDSKGNASVSTVVSGLQWIFNNAAQYNIKVVNLSLDTSLSESYNVDPLDAASEILWFNKIVVVVAAGNNQMSNPGEIDSPANDPFVITVGAVDDMGTAATTDDTLESFSAYGTTVDGFSKPDVVAPGADIISTLASPTDTLAIQHPSHVATVGWAKMFDMSGTSMATAVVSGAVALLLQTNPNLNPDQVKHLLMTTASPTASSVGTGAGEINVNAASQSWDTSAANTGLSPSHALQVMNHTVGQTWDSASWGSASWGSASWGSASWGSASWGSASWGSASWGSASWISDYWGHTKRHPKGDHGTTGNDPKDRNSYHD
jgi:serine protease AprX